MESKLINLDMEYLFRMETHELYQVFCKVFECDSAPGGCSRKSIIKMICSSGNFQRPTENQDPIDSTEGAVSKTENVQKKKIKLSEEITIIMTREEVSESTKYFPYFSVHDLGLNCAYCPKIPKKDLIQKDWKSFRIDNNLTGINDNWVIYRIDPLPDFDPEEVVEYLIVNESKKVTTTPIPSQPESADQE